MSILSINGSDVYEREAERNWAAEYAKRLTDREAAERDAAIDTAVGAEANARAAAVAAEEAARVSRDNALADGTAMENNSILSRHIREGNVTTGKLHDLNVTTPKLADDAVTLAKLNMDAYPKFRVFEGDLTLYSPPASIGGSDAGISSIHGQPVKDSWAREQLAEQSDIITDMRVGLVTGSALGSGAVKAANIADGSVALDKLDSELTTYSTSPSRVGTWVDGTPVWRVAVDHIITSDEITGAAYYALDPVVHNREMVLLAVDGRANLTNETPSVIDVIDCTFESDGTFSWNAAMQSSAVFTHIVGYIEFVTPPGNIITE